MGIRWNCSSSQDPSLSVLTAIKTLITKTGSINAAMKRSKEPTVKEFLRLGQKVSGVLASTAKEQDRFNKVAALIVKEMVGQALRWDKY